MDTVLLVNNVADAAGYYQMLGFQVIDMTDTSATVRLPEDDGDAELGLTTDPSVATINCKTGPKTLRFDVENLQDFVARAKQNDANPLGDEDGRSGIHSQHADEPDEVRFEDVDGYILRVVEMQDEEDSDSDDEDEDGHDEAEVAEATVQREERFAQETSTSPVRGRRRSDADTRMPPPPAPTAARSAPQNTVIPSSTAGDSGDWWVMQLAKYTLVVALMAIYLLRLTDPARNPAGNAVDSNAMTNEMAIAESVLKAAPCGILGLTLWFNSGVHGSKVRKYCSRIAMGLLLGAVGDLLLHFSDKKVFGNDKVWFQIGLVSFLVGHFYYIFAFLVDGVGQLLSLSGMAIGGSMAVFGWTVFSLLKDGVASAPDADILVNAVAAYTAVISVMGWAAMVHWGHPFSASSRRTRNIINTTVGNAALLGAVFFILSDLILAVNKFTPDLLPTLSVILPFGHDSMSARLMNMLTYFGAQLFMDLSATAVTYPWLRKD